MDQIDLRQYDQVVELYAGEADALIHSIRVYLQHLVYCSSHRQLYRHELLSIKPITKAMARLSKYQLATWPRDKQRRPKPRNWKLEVEQVVLFNRLMVDGELFPVQTHFQNDFNTIYGRINQKALNLIQYFEL